MEHSRAYLKVQEGCDEKCSFCIVPQTRGRSRSRMAQSVIAQARGSGSIGIRGDRRHRRARRETTDWTCPWRSVDSQALLRSLLEIPELERLRLSSIEPASISDEIIDLVASEERFARHFHIPFQSASDPILERMRRRYRAADFTALVERIHTRIPGCGIGSDVICGFPGETDGDFQRTFDASRSRCPSPTCIRSPTRFAPALKRSPLVTRSRPM